MEFAKELRAGVRRGEITCSVRIWIHPRVKPGNRYRMRDGEGEIEVDSIEQIELADITPKLARASGFKSVIDLLKTAKHGRGTNVYLVRFHYVAPDATPRSRPAATQPAPRKPNADRQRDRVVRILARLPEATAVARGTHLSLEVRKKRFGYFLDDHHGDGRIAINCKASPDVHDALQQCAANQLHIPKYLGSRGWIGMWLDGAGIDWSVVELTLREAYLLVAPKALAARVVNSRAVNRRRD